MTKTDDIGISAARSGMCENTARKFLRAGRLPSEMKKPRDWRTRSDPFADVRPEIAAMLEMSPRLEAKTILEELQKRHPGVFQDGQLRTLQRQTKGWRIEHGPGREVMFEQSRPPGDLCESDFTHMEELGITIASAPFDHLLYHFVLPYSNWETFSIAFSESFASLVGGLQRALVELGGVPRVHMTDRLSAAVKNLGELSRAKRRGAAKVDPGSGEADDPPSSERAEFQLAYSGALAHLGLEGRFIQAGKSNENGDVEQRHHRFKRAVDQALMLRGSRDFPDRAAYEAFLRDVRDHLNAGRRVRFEEERATLRPLPPTAYPAWRDVPVRVTKFSLARVLGNVYSMDSRLIGERLTARIHAETVEFRHGQRLVQTCPRLIGKGRARIDYRHVIESLARKPGAFAEYRYREELFPSVTFRLVYDRLKRETPSGADRTYLRILEMAAKDGEESVRTVLEAQLSEAAAPSVERTRELLELRLAPADPMRIVVEAVDLAAYDRLHTGRWAA